MSGYTKATVTYGRTVNLGNYESLRVDCALEVAFGVYDTEDQIRETARDAYNDAKELVREQVVELVAKVKASQREAYDHLPVEAREQIGPRP